MKISGRNLRRRFLPRAAAGLAVGYALLASGVPSLLTGPAAPRTTAAAESGYRCAGHGCGCRTAEQCRTRCCCFSAPRIAEGPTLNRETPRVAPSFSGSGPDRAAPSMPACHASPETAAAAAPREAPVSPLLEARCSGRDEGLIPGSGNGPAPHLPMTAAAHLQPDSEPIVSPDPPAFARSADRDPPDKVPI